MLKARDAKHCTDSEDFPLIVPEFIQSRFKCVSGLNFTLARVLAASTRPQVAASTSRRVLAASTPFTLTRDQHCSRFVVVSNHQIQMVPFASYR